MQPILENIMSELIDHATLSAMYRRWAYMLVAIVASAFMFTHPVFNFQEDKGIIYVRSFSMDQKMFYVTQTEIKTGAQEITAVSSVKYLYYCNKAMLWGSIICFLCFFSSRWRISIAIITAFIAGAYYVIMAYYALRIADEDGLLSCKGYMLSFCFNQKKETGIVKRLKFGDKEIVEVVV